jgi:sialate O-acetylesterase
VKKVLLFFVYAYVALTCSAEISFAPIFSDGAVLQCEMSVNIWGTADPGEKILVSFAGQEKQAVASESGRWLVVLDPMDATTEPRELSVHSARATRHSTLSNVVVGEVWLATGQSNMVMPLRGTENGPDRLEKNIPEIRFVKVPQTFGLPVQNEFSPADLVWNQFEPGPNNQMAATAFYFAEKVQAETRRPVGIIQSSYGGTPCEAWTPLYALESHTELAYYAEAVRTAQAAGKSKEEWLEDANAISKWRDTFNQWVKAKKGPRPEHPGPQHLGNPYSPRTATSLYENMIQPLVPYTARGVIWYQGEANAGKPEEYRILFPAMIDAWRTAWNRPDWPFYFVQLAAYERKGQDWAAMRAAQTFVRDTVANTGMALAIDCGEKNNIHPPKKQPVGERLARLALADVYGKAVAARGPVPKEIKKADSILQIVFQHVEEGLQASDGTNDVPGFEVACGDGEFRPVKAGIISKDTVELTGLNGDPVAIRYGWANFPEPPLTMQNSAGLPAEPFFREIQE